MKIRIETEYLENGGKTIYKCPICGKELAREFFNGGATQLLGVDECEHITYEVIGNGCLIYPDNEICKGTEELLNKSILTLQDGTSVYVFIPRRRE